MITNFEGNEKSTLYLSKDKFFKCVQYLTLFLKNYYKDVKHKPSFSQKFGHIYKYIRLSRQNYGVYNLMTSILQLYSILKIEIKTKSARFEKLVKIIIDLIFVFYRLLQNLTIFSAQGILKLHPKPFYQMGIRVKFVAISLQILLNIRNLMHLHFQQILLCERQRQLNRDDMNLLWEQIHELQNKKYQLIRTIPCQCFEILEGANQYKDILFFGFEIPNIVVSFASLISALIRYQDRHQQNQYSILHTN